MIRFCVLLMSIAIMLAAASILIVGVVSGIGIAQTSIVGGIGVLGVTLFTSLSIALLSLYGIAIAKEGR